MEIRVGLESTIGDSPQGQGTSIDGAVVLIMMRRRIGGSVKPCSGDGIRWRRRGREGEGPVVYEAVELCLGVEVGPFGVLTLSFVGVLVAP